MIFIKNPILGKVKTRLAKDLGDSQAVEYYKKLLALTRSAAQNTDVEKWLWYGDFINNEDHWNSNIFSKKLQEGDDLGQRMERAFELAFSEGYKNVVIIGSDCPEISSEILEQAFTTLDSNDAVIGPANDGGYYLLGMTKMLHLFEEVDWSTERVLDQTEKHLKKAEAKYHLLQELTDLDTVEDLKKFPTL